MKFTLRPYQVECQNALHAYICNNTTNPCVVLPTGAGKSISMASIIEFWHRDAPYVRGIVLAHRKELVAQNAAKLIEAYPEAGIGIYSAGLGHRDTDSQIIFASIDSVYKKAGEFPPFDFVFVDEAHRIPPAGEGKYRTFIQEARRFNQNLRVVGFTATAFRMGCGPICHKDHILNEVCYEAKITDLINDGFLSPLRSKVSVAQPNLDGVRRNSGGDYIVKSLADATNKDELVAAAVKEAYGIMWAEKRKAAIFFCVDVAHCHAVSEELAKWGIDAPCVTGKTKKNDRDRIIKRFKAREINAVCCVNVLTEGFDAPHIDCIVLLRPTLSAGLFSQMVGRGLRICEGKKDCLVLDFAGCIEEHGPIDLLGLGQKTVMATCLDCRESFSRAIRECPQCGWVIPKQEIERLDSIEAERRMHGDRASKKSILSTQPTTLRVDSVEVRRHVKPGGQDSLRVMYRCGLKFIREWVCLEHKGYAQKKAKEWYEKRFGPTKKLPDIDTVLQDMFFTRDLREWTKTITFKKNGKYREIIDYNRPLEESDEQHAGMGEDVRTTGLADFSAPPTT